MPRKVPTYRLHKASGRAVVQWRPFFGKSPHYLVGAFNSPESLAEYAEILKKIATPPATPKVPKGADQRKTITVKRLCTLYAQHVKEEQGKSTETRKIRTAIRVLVTRYPQRLAIKFGPKALKRVRRAMLPKGWSRKYINEQIGRIRRIFKWGVSEELVYQRGYAALMLVEGLKKGRTKAAEKKKVLPVEWPHVERVLPFVSPTVADMIRVQYLTGMRSAELTSLRRDELDRSQSPWLYKPTEHKTAGKELEKFIFFGPQARDILRPYLKDAAPYLFTPARAWRELVEMRRLESKTYANPCDVKKRTSRVFRPRYDARTYQQAIVHGFIKLARSLGFKEPIVARKVDGKRTFKPRFNPKKWLAAAGVTYWHPHQLRHTRATETRARYGLEGAVAQLGNSFEATEIYAEKSLALAAKIARETG